ncbi:MAG: FtsQ-type POTRA domain-containing protein [Deltaproteobacteria bacterium]|nr:FtsQ-type POTRA domain-containing protein [Deltaproteobacteria bacterium]
MAPCVFPRPASPWRRHLRRGLWIPVLAGLAWSLAAIARDVRFGVQQVVVENATVWPPGRTTQVGEGEIRHLADVRMGQPLWKVDLGRVVSGVARHPWVDEVQAARRWPSTVVVRITEHVPVLLLQHEGLFYVDREGVVFKRARGTDLDHPVLSGLDPEGVSRHPEYARRVIASSLALLAAVEDSGEFGTREVSEIHVHAQDGFSLILRNGTELAFGFADPLARTDRLARLRAAGFDPTVRQRVDLAPDEVAVVVPLPLAPLVPPGLPEGVSLPDRAISPLSGGRQPATPPTQAPEGPGAVPKVATTRRTVR